MFGIPSSISDKIVKLKSDSSSLRITIADFSDENLHKPYAPALDPKCVQRGFFNVMFDTQVYANGINGANKGYLSVAFHSKRSFTYPFLKKFDISCVVSVIDASGSKRFPTSHVFPFQPEWNNAAENLNHPVVLHRLMKRETLLSEPDDLLPDNCLTLHFDILLKQRAPGPISVEEAMLNSLTQEKSKGYTEYRLPLDSELAKSLREVSPYFMGLSEAPMAEKDRGYAIIPAEEYLFFRNVCLIQLGVKNLSVISFEHLWQIYVTADKYDFPEVIGSLRDLLSVLLCAAERDPLIEENIAKKIPLFLELSSTRNDLRLKEIGKNYLERKTEDADKDSRTLEGAQDNPETEWRLEEVGEGCSYFTFARNSREDHEFSFYHDRSGELQFDGWVKYIASSCSELLAFEMPDFLLSEFST